MHRPLRIAEPAAFAPTRRASIREGLPAVSLAPESQRSALADEARRLRHRQLKAEALALRCVPGRRGLSTAKAEELKRRTLLRASHYQARFHRTIDALMNADGFDEAMQILRDQRRNRRPPVYLLGPHFWG
jgi:hypothetical protein